MANIGFSYDINTVFIVIRSDLKILNISLFPINKRNHAKESFNFRKFVLRVKNYILNITIFQYFHFYKVPTVF